MLNGHQSRIVNKKKLFEATDYKPHAGQQPVHDSLARFRVLIAGRRWGKSLSAAKEAEVMLMTPETRGWVVSTTYDLTRKVLREIEKDLVRKKRMEPSKRQMSGPLLLEFPWGSSVEGKSADNVTSLLGEGLDWLIFDECAQCKQSDWEQYLRPTLSDREGWALFITTPRGYNWVYDLYRRGQDSNFANWASFKSPTWVNPIISKAEIEEARQTLDVTTFQQEYGADFTSTSGRVYGDFREDVHVIPESQIHIDHSWPRYRTLDFGYENPFVCLWIAENPIDDTVIVYDEYFQNHTTIERHAIYLVNKDIGTGVTNSYLPAFDIPTQRYEWTTSDPSGASARATLLENGIPTIGPNIKSVLPGLEIVRQYLKKRPDGKPKLQVSSRCTNLIKEFLLYTYPDIGTNEEPKKENDHGMDAIRYWATVFNRGPAREIQATY